MQANNQLPYYIQKAVELDLLSVEEGKIKSVNSTAIKSVMGTVRIVEKLQPSTIADRDETITQESIVLSRVLTSSTSLARDLWSDMRTAFGVGHGQELPRSLWSMPVLQVIGREIDLTQINSLLFSDTHFLNCKYISSVSKWIFS